MTASGNSGRAAFWGGHEWPAGGIRVAHFLDYLEVSNHEGSEEVV